MEYIDIRIYVKPNPTGVCDLSQKKRPIVHDTEIPIGSRKLALCDDAFMQEVRRVRLVGADPVPSDVAVEDDDLELTGVTETEQGTDSNGVSRGIGPLGNQGIGPPSSQGTSLTSGRSNSKSSSTRSKSTSSKGATRSAATSEAS